MSVQFMIGRAGSGKTTRSINEIREQLQAKPLGDPLIYLVPEQGSFEAEYELASTEGLSGMLRAQVLSFRRLAFRVLQETGGMARIPVDDLGKKMLIYHLLLQHQETLPSLSRASQQMGSVQQILDTFNEWKHYCVTTDTLEQVVATSNDPHDSESQSQQHLNEKLDDLGKLFSRYEAWLSDTYMDAEDYLTQLAAQLMQSEYLRHAEIWVDGFHGFTTQEYEVLLSLMQVCKKVTIALTLDREVTSMEELSDLDPFHPTAVTMRTIENMIETYSLEKLPTVQLSSKKRPSIRHEKQPMLSHLEAYYHHRKPFSPTQTVQSSSAPKTITLNAAVNRQAEIEAIAREILTIVREDSSIRFRDIAMMAKNREAYRDHIAHVFSQSGIPFFMDQKRTVLHHPLVEFIRSALEVAAYHFRYEAVFRCIRTDFLLPVEHAEQAMDVVEEERLSQWQEKDRAARSLIDELENVVLAYGIQGDKWTEKADWDYAIPHIDRINMVKDWISTPLRSFVRKIKRATTIEQQVEALYGLLEQSNVAVRLEQWHDLSVRDGKPEQAREHVQMWNSVMDVLDQLVEVLGSEQVSLSSFIGLVETGLQSIQLALIPPALDQVLIGDIDRTRSNKIKVAFIIGVNDGVLPSKFAEEGMFSEQERQLLSAQGVEMAPSLTRKLLDEQFNVYMALGLPSERLSLSYPLADEEGKSLMPSEVIRRVQAMFPMLETNLWLVEPDAEQDLQAQLSFVRDPRQTLSYLVVQLRQWVAGEAIDDIWWDVYNWFCSHALWREKLHHALYGLFYSNRERNLSPRMTKALYGAQLRTSVSRMEKFASCPFSHFAANGLKLQERKMYKLQAPDVGQLFHEALSHIAIDLQQNEVHWGSLSQEECIQYADKAVDALTPKLQRQILLSSKRYGYISRKLKTIVGKASQVIGEHAKRGEFVPAGVEIGFGPGEALPALSFTLENGTKMEVVGRIDRVDLAPISSEAEHGLFVRVIDYKSSQTNLQMSNVYYGLSLQLLTYLDVVVSQSKAWLGQDTKPAGVLYFHVHHPMIQTQHAVEEQEAKKRWFKQYKMKGLLLAEQEVIQKMDHHLQKGHSDILPVAMKADGKFYKSASVITMEQWQQLQQFVRSKMQQIGTEIMSGNVDIAPYEIKKQTPCQFCAYKAVCQFDPLYEDNDYRHLKVCSREEVWMNMEQAQHTAQTTATHTQQRKEYIIDGANKTEQ
ncbi:helicase-exonuclease AddAB subunit AddB [Longirhabdus pacifica]|uniref:helicase-exonuclease AddAB subunit AddB n=1 Tax=Longirhabdus pacifica TaxID=2305227 RepID=UPI0010090986|nr:helicase-exonuclease AddAB subunit AddB [Longirhabdus pacifica]